MSNSSSDASENLVTEIDADKLIEVICRMSAEGLKEIMRASQEGEDCIITLTVETDDDCFSDGERVVAIQLTTRVEQATIIIEDDEDAICTMGGGTC